MPTSVAVEAHLHDPLLTAVPLPYEHVFFPYGFPARIRSNSPIVMDAAEISWNSYRLRHEQQELDIRCLVSESESAARTEPPVFRSQGHLLTIISDAENFACLDLNAGFSFGWVTGATARSTEYFRQCFLEVMAFPLLEIRDLVTIHAACLQFQNKGVLFAGDSGAGKSSLAYACARRGWTYVSDDASAFVRDASYPTVIGHPQRFRFREPVGELFPEFLGLTSTIRAYGKPTIEVSTAALDGLERAPESRIDYLVFLNRADYVSGPPALLPLSSEDTWDRLRPSVWAIQLPAYEERLAALRRLLRVPAYEIRYREFGPAIGALEELVSAA